jgi:hypothetical protein
MMHLAVLIQITFITHSGLPPKYSHICWTPWSVFQDGSFKTISSASSNYAQYPSPFLAAKVSMLSLVLGTRARILVNAAASPQSSQTCQPASIKRRPEGRRHLPLAFICLAKLMPTRPHQNTLCIAQLNWYSQY